ncbi:MAG: hypothetical protein V8R46_05300 [Eubacterium ramulus]
MKDIIAKTGTDQFARIKVGVGERSLRMGSGRLCP